MVKMFLLFSHTLTEAQKEEASVRFNIDEFIKLPDKLQNIWSHVPSEGDIPEEYLNEIVKFVSDNKAEKNYALIEGEYGLVYIMVRWCMKNNIVPIYATTKRIYKSSDNEDGSITGTHIFRHVAFRLYKDIY